MMTGISVSLITMWMSLESGILGSPGKKISQISTDYTGTAIIDMCMFRYNFWHHKHIDFIYYFNIHREKLKFKTSRMMLLLERDQALNWAYQTANGWQ